MIKSLPDHRFSQCDGLMRRPNGEVIEITVYTYESTNALYDVTIVDGVIGYRTNMGPWLAQPGRFHLSIRDHFDINA